VADGVATTHVEHA